MKRLIIFIALLFPLLVMGSPSSISFHKIGLGELSTEVTCKVTSQENAMSIYDATYVSEDSTYSPIHGIDITVPPFSDTLVTLDFAPIWSFTAMDYISVTTDSGIVKVHLTSEAKVKHEVQQVKEAYSAEIKHKSDIILIAGGKHCQRPSGNQRLNPTILSRSNQCPASHQRLHKGEDARQSYNNVA